MIEDATDAELIAQLERALAHDLQLVVPEATRGNGFRVVETATGRSFSLPYATSDVAHFARDRMESGLEAGVGHRRARDGSLPGVALLAIHIAEAVATATPDARTLVVKRGAVTAK